MFLCKMSHSGAHLYELNLPSGMHFLSNCFCRLTIIAFVKLSVEQNSLYNNAQQWDSTLVDDRMHSRKFMSSYCDTINFTGNNSSSKENKFHVIEDLPIDVYLYIKKVSWLRMKISINACAFYWPHFTCKKA